MRLHHRLLKLRTKLQATAPASLQPPMVVLASEAAEGELPGRWLRADGAVVGVRTLPGQPFPVLPGSPLVIGGDVEPDLLLSDSACFVPDSPDSGSARRTRTRV